MCAKYVGVANLMYEEQAYIPIVTQLVRLNAYCICDHSFNLESTRVGLPLANV